MKVMFTGTSKGKTYNKTVEYSAVPRVTEIVGIVLDNGCPCVAWRVTNVIYYVAVDRWIHIMLTPQSQEDV